jgi:hypothetical protein
MTEHDDAVPCGDRINRQLRDIVQHEEKLMSRMDCPAWHRWERGPAPYGFEPRLMCTIFRRSKALFRRKTPEDASLSGGPSSADQTVLSRLPQ